MNESSGCGELQQLVQEEEGEEPTSRGGEATPPSTPARSHRTSKIETHPSHNSQQVLWESSAQISPAVSKGGSSGQATTSQGSVTSGKAVNSSSQGAGPGNQSRISYLNEKQEKQQQRPARPDPPRSSKHHRVTEAPAAGTTCKHHSFLSEVPDVRRMEQALLTLLEDFHSGNLRAFGKDCSMEQMTEIREQQERLARLHFELGQRQDLGISGEQAGLRQSSANMRHLLHRLQQLSVCIEKLHKMMGENLVGICQEPTTYRHEFRPFAIQRVAVKNRKREIISSAKTKKIPLYAESYDTLQKLDYSTRLPFNALWERKEILGTNLFDEKDETKEISQVSRSKLTEVVSPAVSLDDVKDPELVKKVVDYTYKTTMSTANEEVWRDLKIIDDQLPNENCENSENLISVKPKLIPDLPAGFKGAAKKWDFLQDRRLVDQKKLSQREFVASRSNEVNKCLTRNAELALNYEKFSLPYEKLPSSYCGHRTPIALGVNLERKEKSIQNPDLSVSQVLAIRRSQDFSMLNKN